MDKHILLKCVENTIGTSSLHYDEAKEVIWVFLKLTAGNNNIRVTIWGNVLGPHSQTKNT